MTFLNLIKETYAILEADEPPQDAAMPQDAGGQQDQSAAQPQTPENDDVADIAEKSKTQVEQATLLVVSYLKTVFEILYAGIKDINKESKLVDFISQMKNVTISSDVDEKAAIATLEKSGEIIKPVAEHYGIDFNITE